MQKSVHPNSKTKYQSRKSITLQLNSHKHVKDESDQINAIQPNHTQMQSTHLDSLPTRWTKPQKGNGTKFKTQFDFWPDLLVLHEIERLLGVEVSTLFRSWGFRHAFSSTQSIEDDKEGQRLSCNDCKSAEEKPQKEGEEHGVSGKKNRVRWIGRRDQMRRLEMVRSDEEDEMGHEIENVGITWGVRRRGRDRTLWDSEEIIWEESKNRMVRKREKETVIYACIEFLGFNEHGFQWALLRFRLANEHGFITQGHVACIWPKWPTFKSNLPGAESWNFSSGVIM